jgi:hypothetical protein
MRLIAPVASQRTFEPATKQQLDLALVTNYQAPQSILSGTIFTRVELLLSK